MNLYFNPEQRLPDEVVPVFAENLMDQYPHESLGDLGAFFARASMGRYGERDRDGNTIHRGLTFGRLTMPMLGQWWEQYLEEKATEAEKQVLSAKRPPDVPEYHPKVLEVLQTARLDMGELETGKHVRKLMKYAGAMTDDQLRDEWKKCKTAHERSLIMQEANRRGLVVKAIQARLTNTDKP